MRGNMAKKIKEYSSRKFLNKKSGLAAIEVNFEVYDYSYGYESMVTISDCSRNVRLDFCGYTPKDLAEKYTKLGTLIGELQKLHDHFTENYTLIGEAMEEGIKKRKERSKELKNKKFTDLIEDLNDAK